MSILLAAHKITYYRSRIEDSSNQIQNSFTSTKQQQQQQQQQQNTTFDASRSFRHQ